MKTLFKTIAAASVGVGALAMTAAHAKSKPDYDARSHYTYDYEYYGHDRNVRGHSRRGDGFSVSVRLGDDRYRDGYYRTARNGYRGRDARTVYRNSFDTRHRARIVVREELVRSRRGPRLICNVSVRGPEARYVSERRVKRIANRECSRHARIRYAY